MNLLYSGVTSNFADSNEPGLLIAALYCASQLFRAPLLSNLICIQIVGYLGLSSTSIKLRHAFGLCSSVRLRCSFFCCFHCEIRNTLNPRILILKFYFRSICSSFLSCASEILCFLYSLSKPPSNFSIDTLVYGRFSFDFFKYRIWALDVVRAVNRFRQL